MTRGASRIGEAAVRLFVAQGARVVVADTRDAEGHALVVDGGLTCGRSDCRGTLRLATESKTNERTAQRRRPWLSYPAG